MPNNPLPPRQLFRLPCESRGPVRVRLRSNARRKRPFGWAASVQRTRSVPSTPAAGLWIPACAGMAVGNAGPCRLNRAAKKDSPSAN